MDTYSQIPWTEAQWTRVQETVRDEAKTARVAASFLPVYGPLSEDAQTVPLPQLAAPVGPYLRINDHTTRRLTTLSVNVALRSAQVAQQDLASALVTFRRAANLIARAEDWLVFLGQAATNPPLPFGLAPCRATGGERFRGLLPTLGPYQNVNIGAAPPGPAFVAFVTAAIGILESQGHMGPFALVLNTPLFDIAYTPLAASLVLPADRIKPLLDGPLLRSSTMDFGTPPTLPFGILVSLADDLVDLVVASEIGVRFLQVTAAPTPRHIFRVSQRFTLRIKQATSIVVFEP